MSDFEQIVEVVPAFSKRDHDPAKDFGIGAVQIRFVLKGPKGATQFVIGTDWYLPADQRRLRPRTGVLGETVQPSGWNVGYHSPVQQYEGQQQSTEACEYLNGEPCYYGESGLAAADFVPTFLAGGSDAVWKMLRERYDERFGDTSARIAELDALLGGVEE
jgi:hypothetical protein